jgi:hypothetical protein
MNKIKEERQDEVQEDRSRPSDGGNEYLCDGIRRYGG